MPRSICVLSLFLLIPLADAGAQKPKEVGDPQLKKLLEEIRNKQDVPALAAALITSDGIKRGAAVGVRKRGEKSPATFGDQFHLGSNSKALTATLMARLVEEGKLRWDDPLSKWFPVPAKSSKNEFGKATLRQLLTHRSGLPANPAVGWWKFATNETQSVDSQRREFVKLAFAEKLKHKPGEKFLYSNWGYVIAGALAEAATKSTWEKLLQEKVFQPLGMKTAGFGPMGSPKDISQPWPHTAKGQPFPPGRFGDNPPVVGPAGRVHCSPGDWAKFLADQLKGADGKSGFLKAETYKLLHEAAPDETYAPGGWVRYGGPKTAVLAHDGSNTLNYATVLVLPAKNIAVIAVCNQGGPKAKTACHQALQTILRARTRPAK